MDIQHDDGVDVSVPQLFDYLSDTPSNTSLVPDASARQHVSRSARARDSQTSDSSSTLGKSLRAKKHT